MPKWLLLAGFFISFSGTWLTLKLIVPLLKKADITGRDLHKQSKPEIPEMGGLGILVGISGSLVLAIGAEAFLDVPVEIVSLLAVLSTVLIVSFIGVFDDLLDIPQLVKSLTPIFAALPLMAIRAGASSLRIPLIGSVEFGVFYPLVLVPLGITGAANAVNMLAGFNGMEVGVGLVAYLSLACVACIASSWTALLILIGGAGALVGALWFNWFPAKVLIGDVGTLTIGAIMAAAVIVGNFETAGVIIIIPYFLDFLFKAVNGFPSHGWAGNIDSQDRLRCPDSGPVSLPQYLMKITRGISELHLTLVVMGIEGVFGFFGVLLYLLK